MTAGAVDSRHRTEQKENRTTGDGRCRFCSPHGVVRARECRRPHCAGWFDRDRTTRAEGSREQPSVSVESATRGGVHVWSTQEKGCDWVALTQAPCERECGERGGGGGEWEDRRERVFERGADVPISERGEGCVVLRRGQDGAKTGPSRIDPGVRAVWSAEASRMRSSGDAQSRATPLCKKGEKEAECEPSLPSLLPSASASCLVCAVLSLSLLSSRPGRKNEYLRKTSSSFSTFRDTKEGSRCDRDSNTRDRRQEERETEEDAHGHPSRVVGVREDRTVVSACMKMQREGQVKQEKGGGENTSRVKGGVRAGGWKKYEKRGCVESQMGG